MKSKPCYAVTLGGRFETFTMLKGNATHAAKQSGGKVVPCLIVDRKELDSIRKLLIKGQINKALESFDSLLPRVYSLSEALAWFSEHGCPVQCLKDGSTPILADDSLEATAYYNAEQTCDTTSTE